MKFLDIVENGWASEDNPHRIGIFIRKKGRNFEVTDGKGDFWLCAGDNAKLKVIGNLLDRRASLDSISLAAGEGRIKEFQSKE